MTQDMQVSEVETKIDFIQMKKKKEKIRTKPFSIL